MGNDISENVIYLCYYKTKSLQNVHVCVVAETHAHDYFEVISFYNSKDTVYNILRYVIPHKLRHMCTDLHIKETEISQKRSKGIKNWKITYFVILSVLSNRQT